MGRPSRAAVARPATNPRRRAAAATAAAARPRVEPLERRQLFAAGDLAITEFLTKNDTGIRAADGSRPDWVEVFNPNATAVDLAGWTLAASDVNGVAVTFTVPGAAPAATVVPAGGYKLVWCDGVGVGVNAAGEVHANFKLDRAGGSLALRRPDGVVVTSFAPYPEQLGDVAFGPGPDAVASQSLVSPTSPARLTVPTAGTGANWSQVGFNDAAWAAGTAAVGYENVPVGSAPLALAAEVEPNDAPAAANDATTNFAPVAGGGEFYHLGVSTAALSSASDVDYYRLGPLDAGDVLSIAAYGNGAAGAGANTTLKLYRGPDAFTLTAVATDVGAGPGGDALIDRLSVPATATYYLAVPPHSTTNGAYRLGMTVENKPGTPAPTTTGNVTAEAEFNDLASLATNLSNSWRQASYLSRTAGTIASAADVDVYRYTFAAGDRLTVDARSGGAADLRVALVAADGTTVVAAEDGSSTRAAASAKDSTLPGLVVPTAGTYYVRVTADAPGAYTLDVKLSSAVAPPAPGLGGPVYAPLIGTDVGAALRGTNTSAYVRVPFTLANLPTATSAVKLSVQYDDGFVAYLNGQEVARVNGPGTAGTPLAFNAAAVADRPDGAALTAVAFDLSAFRSLLVAGPNVLAIQGLNAAAGDARFLVRPTLTVSTTTPAPAQYLSPPTPLAANATTTLGQVAATVASAGRGFYSAPIDVTLTTPTVGATIRYTLDGTAPSATAGLVYAGPVHVAATTTLRSAAFKPGFLSSAVDTRTYLFTAGVATQAVPSGDHPAGSYPTVWSDTFPADYAVDAGDVTAGGGTAAQFAAGLVDPRIPTLSVVTAPGSLFDRATGIYQNPVEDGSEWEKAASAELIYPDGTPGFQIDAGLRIQGGTSRLPANQPKHSFRLLFKSQYGSPTLDFPIFGPGSSGLDAIVLRAGNNDSWTNAQAFQRDYADYAKDAWNRATQAAMGHPAVRQQFVQLYLNGLYWGLYDVADRPGGGLAANVVGGRKEQYEVVSDGLAVGGPPTAGDPDGTARAQSDWSALFAAVNSPDIATAAGYNAVAQNLIDPVTFADYIIANFYAGNKDWDSHNYYAFRDPTSATNKGWRFVAWDSERTLESPTEDITGLNTPNQPTRLFRQLMTNAEFRQLFADRVHKAFFNDGALTPAAAAARYASLTAQIASAVADESARWGDYRSTDGSPVGSKAKWDAEISRERTAYFPVRTATVLSQFAATGWYPAVAAPEFAGPFGGAVEAPYAVAVTNPNAGSSAGPGTVYYTLDGTDPRLVGGGLSASARAYDPAAKPTLAAGTTRVLMRVLRDGVWSAVTDATFVAGAPPAVRVSELMYHAAGDGTGGAFSDDDYDFVEIQNVGSTPASLAGLAITAGVTFTFPLSGFPTLAPGGRVVVAGNVTAFAQRYGSPAGVPVMPTAFGGKLSNSGETVTLASAAGQAIESFAYSDQWYPQTDGDGFSLVAVDPPPADPAAYSTAAGWRAGLVVGGTPGRIEPATVTAAVVGDGSAQRSRVTQLAVTFDRAAGGFDAGAFALTRRDPAGGPAVAVPFAATLAADGLSVVLTFAGAGIVSGSLADGVYDWLVRPTLIRDVGGTALGGADRTYTFHRLFGDLNGDKTVNNADNGRFKQSYLMSVGDPLYREAFDYNADGTVNNFDNGQFKFRYLVELDY